MTEQNKGNYASIGMTGNQGGKSSELRRDREVSGFRPVRRLFGVKTTVFPREKNSNLGRELE
jgi:hypothetical protein